MIDIVGLESVGKYIIGLWSKYVKRKHIPYMDLEFHYPNYLQHWEVLYAPLYWTQQLPIFQLNKENKMANIITLKRIGKFIIWFWNKYK